MELNLQQTKTQKKEKNNWEETLKKKTKQTKKDNIVRVYQKPKKKKNKVHQQIIITIFSFISICKFLLIEKK